jgi:hypothetical protein
MGAWSAGIFGNDTSCEVKEYFVERYNVGIDVDEIVSEINDRFAESIGLEDDRYNVLLALYYCLWDTQRLSEDNLREVEELIKSGKDIAIQKVLEADDQFLKSREKSLQKYLQKISAPKEKPRKRVKPPIPLETNFHNGSCLSFRYAKGRWGGAVIIECEFYKNDGYLSVALTDIHQTERPDFSAFQRAHLSEFEWEEYSGGNKEYIAFDSMTARICACSFGYDNRNQRERFLEYCDKFFTVCGKFAPFERCLVSTSGGGHPETDYERFAAQMKDTLFYYSNLDGKKTDLDEPPSKETLSELEPLLAE